MSQRRLPRDPIRWSCPSLVFGGCYLLEAIDAPLDGIEPLILPGGLHHNICKLLQCRFDLGNALIDVLQLRLHSEECCRAGDGETNGGKNVAIGNCAIEQRFADSPPARQRR